MEDVQTHDTTAPTSSTNWGLALIVLMLVAVIAWFVFANTGAMERGGGIGADATPPAATAPAPGGGSGGD